MATCYICGASNATYRRTTYTGSSSGGWISKRSYGSSTRTYYGVRSVCQDCARRIDRWNTIKICFWISVVLIVFIYFLNQPSGTSPKKSQYQYSGKTAIITSVKGLNLRDRPSSIGDIFVTIPYNEIVGILDKNGESETISGRTANWYKVDYNGTTGWLWSGYLEEIQKK